MRSESLKHAIKLAQSKCGPLGAIAEKAVEVGVIVPSVLATKLKEAGYAITYHEAPGESAKEGKAKHGAWVIVKLKDDLVARAYSHDDGDAILQAVYAAMKDEAKSKT